MGNAPNTFTDLVGSATKSGFGAEANYGTPVAAQFLVDHRADGLLGNIEKVRSQAMRPDRSRPKGAAGRIGVEGSLNLEVTPTGISNLLAAVFGTVQTTASATKATSGLVQVGTTVTVTTAVPHGLAVGDPVVVAGVTPAGYNGTFVVLTASDGTHFTYNTTAGLAEATVQGTVAAGLFTHAITPAASGPTPLTHLIKKGDIYVHPGTKINQLTLRCVLDDILTGEFACMALEEYEYDGSDATYVAAPWSGDTQESVLFPASAGWSTDEFFNFTHAQVKLMDSANSLTTTEDCDNIELVFNNNLLAKRALRRTGRTDIAHVPQKFEVTANLDIFFNTSAYYMRSIGRGAIAYPFKSSNDVLTGSMELSYLYGTGNREYELKVEIPNAEFTAPVPPQDGEGFVKQRVTLEAVRPSAGASCTLTLKNSEAALLAAGTPIGA